MFDSLKNTAIAVLGGLLLVLAVMLLNSYARVEVAQSRQRTAEAQLEKEQEAHGRTRDAVASQKREAAALLRSSNASVLAAQNRLDAERQTAEATDVQHGRILVSLRADLQRLRTSQRLQLAAEAGGRGSSGAAQQGAGRPAADGGERDATAAARPLSGETTGARDFEAEADDDAFDADRINVAYAACRRDAIGLRAALAAP